MAYRSGFGSHKTRHEGAQDPKADQAREEIRKVRGGEGEGRDAETLTDEQGRAREPGRTSHESREAGRTPGEKPKG
ncbi:hypothetical protein [Falsiroseomonas oryzae]|uniref:hypothetical protein n=1 Tax=Falsiroseomonas oryzae TaxID=2766473 RepID=UPI0022EB4F6C|nr:hypothetical protein [Roseomonas sp. MO-31]